MRKLLTATILAGWILTPEVSMADIPFLNGPSKPLEYTPKSNCQMFTFPVSHWSAAAAPSSTYIQSVQYFEITIAASTDSNTATISSVDTSRAVIFYDQFQTDNTGNTLRQFATVVTLTDATTVTATRGTTDSSTVIARGYVVDYKAAAVSSVQYGQISLASTVTSNTATISSVTTSRSCVLHLGNLSPSSNATGVEGSIFHTLFLTSSTVVTAERAGSSGASQANFCVVQWATGIVNSNQAFSISLSTNATTTNQTITSVTMGNTMLIWQGSRCNTTSEAQFFYTVQLTSSTNIALVRVANNTTNRVINVTALEFVSGVMSQNVQRGIILLSSSAQNDATITSVDTSRAFVTYCGYRQDTSYTGAVRSTTVKLENATTVRANRDSTSTSGTTINIGWEAVEFT